MLDTTDRRPSVRGWRTAVFAVFLGNGLGMAAIVSRTPSMRDLLGLSTAEVGLTIFAVSAGSILGLLTASHVIHRFGARLTITVALAACGVTLALAGAATSVGSYALTLAAFAVYGVATALCDVGMNVEGGGVERAGGRPIMPWFHAFWSLGSVVSAGLGALAAQVGIPPVAHFAVIGAVMVVGALVATRWLPRTHEPTADEPRLSFRERMSTWIEPRTLLIGLIGLGMAFAEGSANDWLTIGFVDDRGFTQGNGALVFGAFTVAMFAGRLGGVPLLERFGRVIVLRAAAVAALLGMAVVILVPAPGVGIAAVVLWGLGASLGFPVAMSAASDDPARAAVRVSTVATMAYGAFLIGPPVIGFVGQHVGVLAALWIPFVFVAIAGILVPAAREPGRRRG
jgi:fucose permease